MSTMHSISLVDSSGVSDPGIFIFRCDESRFSLPPIADLDVEPDKDLDMFTQCWLNAGPASQTVAQH